MHLFLLLLDLNVDVSIFGNSLEDGVIIHTVHYAVSAA